MKPGDDIFSQYLRTLSTAGLVAAFLLALAALLFGSAMLEWW